MKRALEINGDDLAGWASRIEASSVLPTLVRRLLLATAPLDAIEMRGDGGTRFEGWDGLVSARAGNEFCPRGRSVWELSVREDAKAKIEEDFKKRTAAPGLVTAASTSYVAVTARRFSEKQSWAAKKTQEGKWAEVRALDADDLATWLEQTPGVARWFADQCLHRPSFDVRDASTFLEAWSQRTRPRLPASVLLAGRDKEADEVRAWLQSPDVDPLFVAGHTKEEALLFVAAVIEQSHPATAREALLARSVIVESQEALRWATRQPSPQPLFVLPSFEGFQPSDGASTNAKVVMPLDPGEHTTGVVLRLRRLSQSALVGTLKEAGLPEYEAERLAGQSGGRLTALQRLMGYVALPGWAREPPRDALYALLLAGRWVPGDAADGEVMRQLGSSDQGVQELCDKLIHRPDPAVKYEGAVLTWSSLPDAWRALARGLTRGDLQRFQETVLSVLGAEEPGLGLPPDERFLATLQSSSPPYSEVVRRGLAESILYLSWRSEDLAHTLGAGAGRRFVEGLVASLLRPNWKAWASLRGGLGALAEADPQTFLWALDRLLSQDAAGVGQMLNDDRHTELLWALERIAWLPETLLQVVLHLAALSRLDEGSEEKPGRLGNRPFRSLVRVLHAWRPQSATSVQDRLNALRRVADAEPGVGWRLVLAHFTGPDLLLRHATPVLRPWPDQYKERQESVEHVHEQRQRAFELLTELVGTDEQRWVELLELIAFLPTSLGQRILQMLEQRRRDLPDVDARIWAALRVSLHRLAQADDDGEEQGRSTLLEQMSRFYGEFTPSSPALRHAWLFAFHPDLPEPVALDFDQSEARSEELRQEALEAWLRQEGGWERLGELASKVQAPGIFGRSIGQSPFASEAEERLLALPVGESLGGVLFGFVSTRVQEQGIDWGLSWVRRALHDGRTEDATRIAWALPTGAQTWDAVDAEGAEFRAAYWKGVSILGSFDASERERLVANLLSADRVEEAADAAAWGRDELSVGTVERVLERIAAYLAALTRPLERDSMAIRIEQLLGRLGQAEGGDEDRLSALEMTLLPWVSHLPPSSRLFASLERDPKRFVELVSNAVRRGDEPGAEQVEAENNTKSDAASKALFQWQGYPGRDLPPEQRERALRDWSEAALQMLRAVGKEGAGVHTVANVLARVPEAPDGMWPCLAARELLERNTYPKLGKALSRAKWNLRGMTARNTGEGGGQERAIAAKFRADAEQQRAKYPRTSALLDDLARDYESDADRQDQRGFELREELDFAEPAVRVQRPHVSGGEPGAFAARFRDRIASVRIKNMRCVDDLALELGPLTVLIGENGSGKSSIVEACEILRRAAGVDLLADLDEIHHGLANLLRHDASALHLGVSLEALDGAAPGLDYDLSIVRGTKGLSFLSSERIRRGGDVLWQASPLSGPFSREAPVAERARLQAALRGIEVHVPFNVTAAWANRAQRRPVPGARDSVMVRPAERLELFADNLANVYRQLRDQGEGPWEETMSYLRLGLGDRVESVVAPSDPGGGKVALELKLRGADQTIPASMLADGVLVYLAHVAWFRLPRVGKTLLCFDEPDLHLHPQLSGRLVDLFEAAAQDVPVLVATQSDRLLDGLEDPVESVVVCELDRGGRTRTRRLDAEALSDWLSDYRGVGQVRSAGYLSAVLRDGTQG
jgi:predicted ATPase